MLQNALDQWDCRIFKWTVRLEQNNEKTWFFTCWCKFMEIKSWLKNIGVGMAKNGFGYSCHRTLKLAEPQKGIRGINWFLVCVFSFLFCWKWEFSLLDSHIFCTSSCCHGQNYQNLLQLLWWRINQAICLWLSIILLYATAHELWLFENYFWARSFFTQFQN